MSALNRIPRIAYQSLHSKESLFAEFPEFFLRVCGFMGSRFFFFRAGNYGQAGYRYDGGGARYGCRRPIERRNDRIGLRTHGGVWDFFPHIAATIRFLMRGPLYRAFADTVGTRCRLISGSPKIVPGDCPYSLLMPVHSIFVVQAPRSVYLLPDRRFRHVAAISGYWLPEMGSQSLSYNGFAENQAAQPGFCP